MAPTGLTGEKLIQRLDLFEDDILDLVKYEIQPYKKYWRLLLPPGSETFPKEIYTLTRRKIAIESQYPTIINTSHDHNEWCKLYINNGQYTAKGKIKREKYADGTTNKLRLKYEIITSNISLLEKKCLWKNFMFPQKDDEKEEITKTLLNARYKMEDILALENPQEHDLEFHNQKEKEVRENFLRRTDVKWAKPQKSSAIEETEELPDAKLPTDTAKGSTPDESQNQGIPKPDLKFLAGIGKKGGEQPKINQPILEAITIYMKNNKKINDLSNEIIAKRFCNKHHENNAMTVTVNNTEGDVYYSNNRIYSIVYKSGKKRDNKQEKSIAYSTLRNIYIPKAKEAILLDNSK